MANIVTTNSAFSQLNSLSQMNIVRQLGFMLIVAAGIALGTAIVLWSTSASYTPLYQNMSTQDSASIIAALEQTGTPYKIDNNTRLITVPSDQVQRIRLDLANNGLPESASRGYEILEDEQTMGTSNFIEQARYQRALEQELVRTIKHVQGVRDARVHLSIPTQSSFIRSANKASASVMLDLLNMQAVDSTQLVGILHLVASSVAGLEIENVSIIDQRGNLLSQHNDSDINNSSENIRFIRKIEEDYTNRILSILTPIVGEGNVRAQVSADLDFTIIETTEEIFDPNTAVVRSEQTQEESSGMANTTPYSVEPGTLSTLPPTENTESDSSQSQSNSNQTRTNSTRNYEIDRRVSLIKTAPGAINKLSVAVLVDLNNSNSSTATPDGEAPEAPALDQEKIDRLTQLVKNTIGFNELRGDFVNVISEQFIVVEDIPPVFESTPIWQQDWVLPTAKQLGAGLVVIFLIFGVLRPAMKSVINTPNSSATPAIANNSSDNLSEDKVTFSGEGGAPALDRPATPAKSAYDQNLVLAQEIVHNEPARAARMIQSWLAND